MIYLYVILGLVVLFILFFLLRRRFLHLKAEIFNLPLRQLGFKDIPGFPIQLTKAAETVLDLQKRSFATRQATNALSNKYKIGETETTAYKYLYGKDNTLITDAASKEFLKKLTKTSLKMVISKDLALRSVAKDQVKKRVIIPKHLEKSKVVYQELSLEKPEQFAISFTNYFDLLEKSKPYIQKWNKTLEDVKIANKEFWPTIATYGIPYNLIIIEKVNEDRFSTLKQEYKDQWSVEMDDLQEKGLLYDIDMREFEKHEQGEAKGSPRFTPGTHTFLKLDPETKEFTPFVVWVSGYEGKDKQCYHFNKCTNGAWLYALQAAKVSITVYGVWLGHIYQWHIVTAAMQMTMYNNFPTTHPIYELLGPISDYLIGFDNLFLFLWEQITPPTSFTDTTRFIKLMDSHAKGRKFFDDDPPARVKAGGLDKSDFSKVTDWDQYKIVKNELQIWDATKAYAKVFVESTYPSDESVQKDKELQKWIKDSSDKNIGNIKGLPEMKTREALIKVLTSYIFRISVHGLSRTIPSTYPGLPFVANFPPCLQRTDIPKPSKEITTKELLTYLPNTGSIGGMLKFYSIFIFSAPYETAIPLGGVTEELFFNNQDPEDPRNVALIKFREFIIKFVKEELDTSYDPNVDIQQWARHIDT